MGNQSESKCESRHIFIWPFRIEEEKCSTEDFCGILGRRWTQKSMTASSIFKNGIYDKNFKDVFALNQYLSLSARGIFCKKEGEEGEKKEVCSVYSYYEQPLKTDEGKTAEETGSNGYHNLKYYIRKEKEKTFEFSLPINDIELHIYRHGVGILFLSTEYHPEPDISDDTFIDHVRIINDYGRRISLPFLPADRKDSLCADEVGILVGDNRLTEKYGMNIECINNGCKNSKDLMRMADFLYKVINHVLDGPLENSDTKTLSSSIHSFADDRMFVMSLVCSPWLSDRIKNSKKTDNFFLSDGATEANSNLDDILYTLAYVDSSGYPTCQNAGMKKKLLEEACYLRWTGEGTVHCVTKYSFLCITGAMTDIEAFVATPFLSEYNYVFSVVIAQKLGIQNFDERAGKLSDGVKENSHGAKKMIQIYDKKNQFAKLQEEYATFKNQIMLLEITSQDQGIELYQLLQKRLEIEKEEAILCQQIDSIYQYLNMSYSNSLSSWALTLAIAAIIIDICLNVVQMPSGWQGVCANCGNGLLWSIIFVIVAALLFFGIGIGLISAIRWITKKYQDRCLSRNGKKQ